jgi:hypothetical protein
MKSAWGLTAISNDVSLEIELREVNFAQAICLLHYSQNHFKNPFLPTRIGFNAYNALAMELITGNKQ